MVAAAGFRGQAALFGGTDPTPGAAAAAAVLGLAGFGGGQWLLLRRRSRVGRRAAMSVGELAPVSWLQVCRSRASAPLRAPGAGPHSGSATEPFPGPR